MNGSGKRRENFGPPETTGKSRERGVPHELFNKKKGQEKTFLK